MTREELGSEARQAERTGALGGFRWTACLACALPVQVSGWGRRGGWQETRSSSCTGVCYSMEKLPVTRAVRAHSRADFGLLYLLPRARTQTAVSRVLISYPLAVCERTGGRLGQLKWVGTLRLIQPPAEYTVTLHVLRSTCIKEYS